VGAGRAHDADDVPGCNGTEEGGAAVGPGRLGGGGDASEEGGADVRAV